MKKEFLTEETIVSTTKVVYIAFDGTEFNTAKGCNEYERELYDEELMTRTDIEKCQSADDCMPFIGLEMADNSEYLWVRPLTEDAMQWLKTVYPDGYSYKYAGEVGEWICIEISDSTSFYWYGLEQCKRYVEDMGKKLGFSVAFTCKAGKHSLKMPAGITIGSLINIADDGTISAASSIGANTYRVLSMSGSTAKLLKMQSIGNTAFNSSSVTTTFSNGQTGQQYEGSPLDTKMETFYHGLTEAVQNAIVPQTISQSICKWNGASGTLLANTTYSGGSYAIYQMGTVTVSEQKNVFALDATDVVEYLGSDFTYQELMTMFYDSPSTGSKYIWLRSASSYNSFYAFNVYGNYGTLGSDYYDASYAARPAFVINITGVLGDDLVPDAPGGGDTPGGDAGGSSSGGSGEAGALSMPAGTTQGALVNIADDGTITAATTIGINTYRVLSMSSCTAKLLKMQSIGNTAFNNSSVKTTFSNGYTYQKYENSTLDSKMTTFFNGLPGAVQNAIVEQNITQKVYRRNDCSCGGSQVASATKSAGFAYQIFELGSVAVGNRKVWAPGVEDVIDYLGDSWTSADLMNMFFDSPSTVIKSVWLRSASSDDFGNAFHVNGRYGSLSGSNSRSSYEARPTFVINIK